MMNGILNILKPTGMTSHDVVSSVRKILNTKKVGHAGTLDPNVSGVLVICVGKGTKFSDILINGDKEYICEMVLGKSTDTQDMYGQVTAESEVPKLDETTISNVMRSFMGEQLQVPPAFSAVKLNGKKLYEYARDNIIVEKEGKIINIKDISLLDFHDNKVLMKIKCSKGTYMRTLCNDMGIKLGTYAHMGVLIRVASKGLKIEDSITLPQLRYLNDNNRLDECFISFEDIVPMEEAFVDNIYYNKLLTGNEVPSDTSHLTEDKFYIYCEDELVGIGHKTNINEIKIDKMLI